MGYGSDIRTLNAESKRIIKYIRRSTGVSRHAKNENQQKILQKEWKRDLKWFGHIFKMDNRWSEKIFAWTPPRNPKGGRALRSWNDGIVTGKIK